MNPSLNATQTVIPRRSFLKATALTALTAPYIVPSSVFGTSPPSNRITVGCVGVGNQGLPNLQRFLKQDDCQVLAVCDVNRGSNGYKGPADLRGREPAKQEVERFYAEKNAVSQYKGCDAYNDFRELLTRIDIDAVMFCARSLARTDDDCGRQSGQRHLLRKAARTNDRRAAEDDRRSSGQQRILQTGSHERSNPIVRQACGMVRNGEIGDVKRVVTNVGRHNKVGPGPGLAADARARWVRLRIVARPSAGSPVSQRSLLVQFPFQL